jgi:ketosteroid isomerase-like protein
MTNISFSEATAEQNLEHFITSEEAFNDRDFDRLASYHADDVVVQMPDGSVVHGVEQHMQDLRQMLVWAPDFKVVEYVTEVASGDWTATVGVLTGTFSEPMPLPDGTSMSPTGKSANLQVATFARWKDGQIAEESLFWDGAAFASQLGLA